MIGEYIEGRIILERKIVATCLERKKRRICKTIYRMYVDERSERCNGTRENKWCRVKIYDR